MTRKPEHCKNKMSSNTQLAIKALVSFLIFFTLLFAARAAEKDIVDDVANVDSPLCKAISSKVQEFTHATFNHFSEDRTSVWFRHPLTGDIIVGCYDRIFLNVTMSVDSPYPSDLWFALAALAGKAIADLPDDKMEVLARSCQRTALMNTSHLGSVDAKGVHIECGTFTDPPGSTISFFLRDAINNQVLGDNLAQ